MPGGYIGDGIVFYIHHINAFVGSDPYPSIYIRQQGFVGDKEFAKSMIPHHAAAILMAKEAKLTDPELQKLQQDIITAQEKEIKQMKDKLAELDK